MKHIFLIDPLEKLHIKKDTSLFMALSFRQAKEEVYFLFAKDLHVNNFTSSTLTVHSFSGSFVKDDFYLSRIKLGSKKNIQIKSGDMIHLRLDPPVDAVYIRQLWLLQFLQAQTGVKIMNHPAAVMLGNEKLMAAMQPASHATWVGSSSSDFLSTVNAWKKKGVQEIVCKPLEQFGGQGVKKINLKKSTLSLKKDFSSLLKKYAGPVLVQPFIEKVYQGEIRALYFKGKELGSLKKVPKKGNFLSNIAQGASFESHQLTKQERKICDKISRELLELGIYFIGFDILDQKISEINITCPTLLVQVSSLRGKNLALEILKFLT